MKEYLKKYYWVALVLMLIAAVFKWEYFVYLIVAVAFLINIVIFVAVIAGVVHETASFIKKRRKSIGD